MDGILTEVSETQPRGTGRVQRLVRQPRSGISLVRHHHPRLPSHLSSRWTPKEVEALWPPQAPDASAAANDPEAACH